jgi:hypothetical protein
MKLIDVRLEDLSTKNFFLFRIRCESCGKEYSNRPVRFSKAGVAPQTREKQILHDAIYEQESRDARKNAIRQVAEHMNHCPICKQLVCNHCFLICEELDICCKCAAQLKQTGTPVLSDILESGI